MVLLLSVSTSNQPNVFNFEQTLRKHGWEYRILGMGDKWGGWRYRMQKYRDACRDLPAEKLVVLSDASDVLAARGPEAFEERWAQHFAECRVVVSATNACTHVSLPGGNCLPTPELWEEHLPADKRGKAIRFPNAGLIAGRAAAIAEMWDWCLSTGESDDQVAVCKFLQERAHLKDRAHTLDFDSVLFYTDNEGVQSVRRDGEDFDPVEQQPVDAVLLHYAGMRMHVFSSDDNYRRKAREQLGAEYMEPEKSKEYLLMVDVSLWLNLVLLLLLIALCGFAIWSRFRSRQGAAGAKRAARGARK